MGDKNEGGVWFWGLVRRAGGVFDCPGWLFIIPTHNNAHLLDFGWDRSGWLVSCTKIVFLFVPLEKVLGLLKDILHKE